MRLTIAGCGTATPDPERVASGYFMEAEGLKLLLDCGPGVVHHMARFGIDWQNITHLLVTHFHNDHIGDIPALFFAWKWGMLPARSAPLHIVGPTGIQKKLKHMAHAMGNHMREPGFEVTVSELRGEEEIVLNDVVHVKTLSTPHSPESLAYRISEMGFSLGYTGDTGYSEKVAAFLSRVDVLIMECSLPDDQAMDRHLTPATAARMGKLANPGTLVLTPAYPQLNRGTLAAVMRDCGWTGKTIIARDGLVLE